MAVKHPTSVNHIILTPLESSASKKLLKKLQRRGVEEREREPYWTYGERSGDNDNDAYGLFQQFL